ncbi:putative transposase [Thermodesulfovibrio yellowstonii DSM 11347]|uniref:Transposase n=1 Tax=Thermodesulfovibrio yellowstonii (strain ATCC 51303 / DSM 11347 / YP87) TaxID=289376 RepID=B5YKB2_THEYD|nr:putative transposase [Thermodesulfovibrio yellowstonii DSM 11347]
MKESCKALGLSRSRYYSFVKSREAEKPKRIKNVLELVLKIKAIKAEHPFWGYRRVTAWLRHREGVFVNHKTVRKIMKEHGLLVSQIVHRAKRKSEGRKPRANRPKEIWGIDMTKFMIPCIGWAYLIVVLDWYTKKIVGLEVSLRARTAEWMAALDKALQAEFQDRIRGSGLKLVSDNGSQPTSRAFMREMAVLGVEQIFTSYDNPKGNADTERVIRTIKEELIWLNEFRSLDEAREMIEDWITNCYNRLYVHSALGYLSPEEYELKYYMEQKRNVA